MNIPEEAVEAAADEIDDAVGGGTDEGWADRTARAALEAAAPLLMAQALREAADGIGYEEWGNVAAEMDEEDQMVDAVSVTIEILRVRADELAQ